VDGRGQRQRGAVFVQDEWSLLGGRLDALPGVRLDGDSQFGLAPTPRLGLAWFASEALTLRGNAGLGFRAPDFKELYVLFANPAAGYVAEGNPDLRPERSFGATVAADLDLDRVGLDLQAFRNELVDLIDYQLDTSGGFSATQIFQLRNVARARTQGVDGTLTLRPAEGLSVRGGGQLLDSVNLTPDDPAEGLPLQNRAPVSATFGALYTERRSGLSFTLDGAWNGQRAIYADDGGGGVRLERADGVVLLDARLEWKAAAGARLYAGVENLLDGGDAELNQVKPRWVYAGVRGTFDAGG
jgi:outer membrane receptor for ferrienterochelin and colicins